MYFALPKDIGLIGPQRSDDTLRRGSSVLSETIIERKGVRVCLPSTHGSQLPLNLMPSCRSFSLDGWKRRS